jgi:hypothetical protein
MNTLSYPTLSNPSQPNPTKKRGLGLCIQMFYEIGLAAEKRRRGAIFDRNAYTEHAPGLNDAGGISTSTTTARECRCLDYTLRRSPGSKNRIATDEI